MATAVNPSPDSDRYSIRHDSLAQSVVFMLAMTVIQRAVGFGRSILICDWLPAESLGQWDLTLSFLDLAAPIAVLSLPACFGRYVEHYRQRGHLRTFLWRTTAAVGLLTALSVTVLYLNRNWFAQLLYGHTQGGRLVLLVSLVLPFLILLNTVTELLSGLRMYRMVTVIQFAQSLLFAAMALLLVRAWDATAGSVILAYGAACALCSMVPLYWLGRTWWLMPESADRLPQAPFWGKLMPFVLSVWISNWLANLFVMIDRYLIIHYAPMTPTQAIAAVGQYHSARVVPILLISVAGLLGTMIVPFLSHDWEAGRRSAVSTRINTFIKAVGLGLAAAGALVLLVAPWLFGWVFHGKFDGGFAILPYTLMCACWFGMLGIAKSYLWCDERVWLVSVALLIGMAINVALSLVLLPVLGLLGAVVGASAANATALMAVYLFSRARGMHIGAGTWIVTAVPATLCLGPWATLGTLAALGLWSALDDFIFAPDEKAQLLSAVEQYWSRLCRSFQRAGLSTRTADT